MQAKKIFINFYILYVVYWMKAKNSTKSHTVLVKTESLLFQIGFFLLYLGGLGRIKSNVLLKQYWAN